MKKAFQLNKLALTVILALGVAGCASNTGKSAATGNAATTPTSKAPESKPAAIEPVKTAAPEKAASPDTTAAPTDKPLAVAITAAMSSADILVDGNKVTIMRNQNEDNTVNANFSKTSRKCPPFCIQPFEMAPGVKTIGELEMIEYLKKAATDPNLIIIDSRTPDWLERGTIPGAVNIPWDKLNIGKSDPFTVQDILTRQMGVVEKDGFWDYSNAKTLVLFCNGQWCGQSPTNIKGLLKIGYPPSKLIWYRGGMQEWELLGLTTVKPAK